MEYYKNNVNVLLKEKPKKTITLRLIIIVVAISSFMLLKTEVYDYHYVYASVKKENNLLNLNTNVILEYNEEIINSTIIRYDNDNYEIKNIIIDSYNTDTYGNVYSNITFQIDNDKNFKENSYVKIKLLKNKQSLIYKIKKIII